MSEWKEVKIGDVCSVKRGASPRPIQNFMCKNGMPWVKIADATRINSRYIYSTEEYITEAGVPKSRTVTPGTLIVSNSATPGLPKIMGITGCVHDGWLIINDFNGVLKEYMYYKFIDIRRVLSNQANGSVFMNLKTDIVKDFPIKVPSIQEQEVIVAFLNIIDAKIECNRKICENLEAQAQALFKHWFIDFAPFKDGKFVESELGMIPEGWRVGTLGDIADLIKPSIKPLEDVEYSHYSIPAYDNNQIPSIEKGGTIKSNKFAIQDSVTLLSKLNPDHKRIWFISKVRTNAICSTEFLPFYAKDREHSAFIYCYLNSWRNYREIANGAKGTTNSHQRIDSNAILSRKLAYDKDTITMFCIIVGELLKLENKAIRESTSLAQLRDTLLPKLMSGELKVNDSN